MKPIQIKVTDKTTLNLRWDDQSISAVGLKYLRDECPCANCKGETILLKTYRSPKPTVLNADMYKVKNIQQIGGYAVQITWLDGHNTGIYTWDYLKKLSEDEQSGKNQTYNTLL